MRTVMLVAAAIVTGLFSIISGRQKDKLTPRARHVLQWYKIQVRTLDHAAGHFLHAVTQKESDVVIQQRFAETREAYKHLELLLEYFNPSTAKALNGPNLPEAEPDNHNMIIDPEGFLVLEGKIFPRIAVTDTAFIRRETLRLVSNIERVKVTANSLLATDAQLFDAMRQELLRIMALGISGFDSPIAQRSLKEAEDALDGVKAVWLFYEDDIDHANPDLSTRTNTLFLGARQMLRGAKDFAAFSRMHFIREYLTPLTVNIKLAREALHIPYTHEPRFLDPAASHVFEKDAFNPAFFSPDQTLTHTRSEVALGRKLFYDSILPAAAALQPQDAVLRNTPTLINAALQPGQFYDQRGAYLEDAVEKISVDEQYGMLFKDVFGKEVTEQHIRRSIAPYIRSLVQLNSRFDDYMRGHEGKMNAAEIRGFDLFMGKAKCGTCHFVPLFNGTVPPAYSNAEAEVPAWQNKYRIDPDEEKYALCQMEHQRFAFKTPTLRNIASTAPYMHNGIYATLEEVLEFYNNGGGAGMGVRVNNQTLPKDSLHLTRQEQADIIAFLKTLNSEMN